MPTWQYKIVVHETKKLLNDDGRLDAMSAALGSLGDEGWEPTMGRFPRVRSCLQTFLAPSITAHQTALDDEHHGPRALAPLRDVGHGMRRRAERGRRAPGHAEGCVNSA